LIDFKGDYKIPLNNYDFGLSWNSENGYLVVSKNKKFGLVNYLSDKSELDFLYDSIEYAGESMFFVKKNNKWAIYNPEKDLFLILFIKEIHILQRKSLAWKWLRRINIF
jgi:hypothetical protein